MDIENLSDDELDQARIDIAIEQERRQALAQIPAQVAELCGTYCEGGGSKADLIAAIESHE